eukprot:TRINITY_DN4355_c0_g1_i4.p1 TRINITY_DN4355_c0_g1~~TRINITY_DN4355_c0_g1_i4.p1  ORF type:complete len:284 (+),score=40.17 TRINITY_DN4355_c0_g1_i4:42-893(+)
MEVHASSYRTKSSVVGNGESREDGVVESHVGFHEKEVSHQREAVESFIPALMETLLLNLDVYLPIVTREYQRLIFINPVIESCCRLFRQTLYIDPESALTSFTTSGFCEIVVKTVTGNIVFFVLEAKRNELEQGRAQAMAELEAAVYGNLSSSAGAQFDLYYAVVSDCQSCVRLCLYYCVLSALINSPHTQIALKYCPNDLHPFTEYNIVSAFNPADRAQVTRVCMKVVSMLEQLVESAVAVVQAVDKQYEVSAAARVRAEKRAAEAYRETLQEELAKASKAE